MPLVVSDDFLRRAGMTEEELRLEIAILLFQRERLTLAQGSRLAGVTRLEFQKTLANRRIPVHYDVDDFQEDLKNLKEARIL